MVALRTLFLRPPRLTHRLATEGARSVFPTLLVLLVASAMVDWLVTRTLTRLAIFIPKTPAMIVGYQIINDLGQAGSAVAAFTALWCIGCIVLLEWKRRKGFGLAAPLAALALLVLFKPLAPTSGWLVAYHVLTLVVLLVLAWRGAWLAAGWTNRLARFLPALAMLVVALYQAGPALYAWQGWSGPPGWGLSLFRLGEVLVLLGAVVLWWSEGRSADRKSWVATIPPTLFFATAYLFAPAMTATLVIWSHGLTLSLPWPFYAAALWLYSVAIAWSWRNGRRSVAGALLLLLAAGYAPQLSSQFWFGVIALWLLTEEIGFQSRKNQADGSLEEEVVPRPVEHNQQAVAKSHQIE